MRLYHALDYHGALAPIYREAEGKTPLPCAMTLHNAAVQHEHLEQWKHALAVRQSRFSAPCLFLACY